MEANRLEHAFNECLEQMLGGATLEQALTPYANLAEELKPMLQVALAARGQAQAIRPPRAAQLRSRQLFLAAAVQADLAEQEAHGAGKAQQLARKTMWNNLFALPLMARALIVLLLVLALGGTSSVAAAGQALPGDVLYPLKLAAERTRLLLASSPAARLELEQSFDQKRLDELNTLLKRSRSEEITFAGELNARRPGEWTVQQVRVLIDAQTRLPETAAPGFYVEVKGILQPDGSVLAAQIAVRRVELGGVIEAIGDEMWVVEGLQVRLDARTLLRGLPAVGQRALVQAYRLADGTLLAISITLEGAGEDEIPVTPVLPATQTLVPTSTSTPEPTQTLRPSATPTSDELDDDDELLTSTDEPEETEEPDDSDSSDDSDDSNDSGSSDDSNDSDDSDDSNGSDDPDDPDNPDETEEPDDPDSPDETKEPDDD